MESILVALLVGGFFALMLPMVIVPLLGTDADLPEANVPPTPLAIVGRLDAVESEERVAA